MLKIALLCLLFITQVHASVWDDVNYRGEFSLSYRQFAPDDNKDNKDQQFSQYGRFAIEHETDKTKILISAFGRYDTYDHTRNIFNFDEAYFKFIQGNWSFSLGNHNFNWSVLEIFHPIDTINSRNFDSNAELIERLGQPAFVITREFNSSILQVIALLKTINPKVPSPTNRNGPQVYLETPRYIEGDNKYTSSPQMPQGIIRYLHNFDSFDLDIHVARKYDTLNPLIGKAYPSIDKIQATPFFLPVTQYGMAVQGTYESLIYKIEHIRYDFDNYKICTFINCVNYNNSKPDYSLTALGLEYTKTYKNDQEGTFFLEYQTVLGTTIEQARMLNPFQRDAALGYRHNFNDFNGHEIIAIFIGDLDQYDEQIYHISHGFRLSESWKWHTELRVIQAQKPSNKLSLDNFQGLKPISQSDNIFFKLTKFF